MTPTKRGGIHLMMPKVIKDFEEDARTQIRFNLTMAWTWFLSMIVVAFIFPATTRDGLIQLLILEVSLWANFATHYGAISSAQASRKGDTV